METLENKPVLVIEPKKAVQTEIRKALPKVDLKFVTDGKSAVAQLLSDPPDLVLFDLAMPTLDGFEVLKQLRSHKSLIDTPVVFITEQARSEHDSSELALISRQDFSTMLARLSKLVAERAMQRSFREAYERVLADAETGALDLTSEEIKALKSAAFPIHGEVKSAPAAARAAMYDAIIASSLTTEQAAKKLGVNTSRIRQRLLADPPQLYGIRRNSVWWLPKFQFGRKDLVPGIDKVIARLDSRLDPVAVDTWFRTPNVDLEDDDDALSPLNWLTQGRNYERVAELAEDL
jgi:CheY-like chemotaxis protein